MFSLICPPLYSSKCFTNQWEATSADCHHTLCCHCCTDVGHGRSDPQVRLADTKGRRDRHWIVCAADAMQAGRVCYLQQLNVGSGLSFCFISNRAQMSAGTRKRKKSCSFGWRPCRGKGWLYSAWSPGCHRLAFLFHTTTRTGMA